MHPSLLVHQELHSPSYSMLPSVSGSDSYVQHSPADQRGRYARPWRVVEGPGARQEAALPRLICSASSTRPWPGSPVAASALRGGGVDGVVATTWQAPRTWTGSAAVSTVVVQWFPNNLACNSPGYISNIEL